MKKITLIAGIILTVCVVNAQIIHVPEDYPTIQEGIDAAVDGDTVFVDGDTTYFENIKFNGKAITVASNFILDNDTTHINNTIIDGSQPENPNQGSVVTFMDGEDTTSILIGFTITGGTGLEIASQRMGGGIVCFQSGAKILNNKIINNEITYTGMTPGGGICSFFDIGETWVVIENNIISGNICSSDNDQAFGGGIAVGTNARIENNQIYNNHCYASVSNGLTGGGGLYIESSSQMDTVIVKSNNIHNNELESYYCNGAGVYNSTSFLYLSDNAVNSNTTFGTYSYGSAIFIIDIDGEVTIENNMVIENSHQSVNVGAATILIWSFINPLSLVNIKHNIINNNSAEGDHRWGTAIHLRSLGDFLVVIDGNIIVGNEGFSGSGLFTRSSFNYHLTNNVFAENYVSNIGGAILSYIASKDGDNIYLYPEKPRPKSVNLKNKSSFRPLIANNTFVGNHSGDLGGAVYLSGNYDSLCPVFINNIFYNNTADNMDYEIHHSGAEELLISNNNIDITRIYGNWNGTGNIAGDPDFIDTLFHIDDVSPCFNTGIDSVMHDGSWYVSPTVDFEDDPRSSYGGVDIGADEYFVVGVDELVVPGSTFSVLSYPNPFSSSTTIVYELAKPENVKITIFNHLGQQIERLDQKNYQSGSQQYIWDASGLPSGIYFVQVRAGQEMATRKIVKMR